MAKSSFWDDLGNALTRKAKGLSSKAENLYEIQKIRNKLSAHFCRWLDGAQATNMVQLQSVAFFGFPQIW